MSNAEEHKQQMERAQMILKHTKIQNVTMQQYLSALQEHSSALQEHSSALQEHSSLQGHSSVLQEFSSALQQYSSVLQDQANMARDMINVQNNNLMVALGLPPATTTRAQQGFGMPSSASQWNPSTTIRQEQQQATMQPNDQEQHQQQQQPSIMPVQPVPSALPIAQQFLGNFKNIQGQRQTPILPAHLAIPDPPTTEQPLSENSSILGNRAVGDVPSLAGATTTGVDAGSFDATEEPEQPASAFLKFANERRHFVERKHPTATVGQVSTMLSFAWDFAPAEVRETYQKEAFDLEMEQYYQNMVTADEEHKKRCEVAGMLLKQHEHQNVTMQQTSSAMKEHSIAMMESFTHHSTAMKELFTHLSTAMKELSSAMKEHSIAMFTLQSTAFKQLATAVRDLANEQNNNLMVALGLPPTTPNLGMPSRTGQWNPSTTTIRQEQQQATMQPSDQEQHQQIHANNTSTCTDTRVARAFSSPTTDQPLSENCSLLGKRKERDD